MNADWIEASQKRLDFFTYQDVRLERILEEVQQRAKEKGFPVFPIKIRMIKSFVRVGFDGEARYPDDKPNFNLIYISGCFVHDYTDDHLRILIAHEVGHIIDGRSKRAGCPIFSKIACLASEEFADFVSGCLYSKDMFLKAAEECGYKGESLKRIRNLDISIA